MANLLHQPVCKKGITNKIKIPLNIVIIPKLFLGTARKIVYNQQKYHSGRILEGVFIESALIQLVLLPKSSG